MSSKKPKKFVYSSTIGNPFHGKSIDVRRKLNLKDSNGRKRKS